MMEWRVIEQRDQVTWSGGGTASASEGRPRPGFLNYIAAAVTLVATGIVAFFAFSFVLILVVPALVIGAGVMWWRWRRLIKAHQSRVAQGRQEQRSEPGESGAARPFKVRDDADVIDV